MIGAAAVVPGPPLLVPELSGGDATAATLRGLCLGAVANLIADDPDRVVVIGAGDTSARWPSSTRLDIGPYRATSSQSTMERPGPPLSLGIGAWLLDQVGCRAARMLLSVAADVDVATCEQIGGDLAEGAERTALLVVADGSARRTVKAPGYLDPRAEVYDGAVRQALVSGELAALAALDPGLAAELLASGWAAVQVLRAALAGRCVRSEVGYDGAPYGVGYLVALVYPNAE